MELNPLKSSDIAEMYPSDISWMVEQIKRIPDKRISLLISEWAEKKRYLSSAVTANPGQWSNKFAPFMVEIMDRFCPDNPTKEVALMKGGQVTATTAVVENWIGYIIDVAPGPTMYLTGSESLIKDGIEIRVDRMLESAGLMHKIRAPGKSTKKSGNTTARKDFRGGFLLAHGLQSALKLRQNSIQNLIIDELEAKLGSLGRQGDPVRIARGRQKGFDGKRKTLYLSTPISVDGPIHKLFKLGDQRYYYVPCKYCGFMQMLEFRGKREDGKRYGITYELDKEFVLIFESVEYRCKNCLKGWKNFDKYDFLNAGEWRATAKSRRNLFYSYQLGSEYSPEGSYSWESLVEDWLVCWDSKTKRVSDVEALRVFQNESRGLPFEERGEAAKFERVIQHRRSYERNKIPNKLAIKETGSPILVLTAAVDVHKRWLGVEIKGWCHWSRSYSIDYRKLEGSVFDLPYNQILEVLPENENKKKVSKSGWEALMEIIENEIWEADDGKKYQLSLTLIDAGYQTDLVYTFCGMYSQGVYAIMGRDTPPKSARMSQFSQYERKGIIAYNVNVTWYKDRLSVWLRRDWNDGELQPEGYPNYPVDYGDDYFREYTNEEKVKKINNFTHHRTAYLWKKIKDNAPVHALDCAVYNAAALEMLCYNVNLGYLEQDRIDYSAFWDYISKEKLFYFE